MVLIPARSSLAFWAKSLSFSSFASLSFIASFFSIPVRSAIALRALGRNREGGRKGGEEREGGRREEGKEKERKGRRRRRGGGGVREE